MSSSSTVRRVAAGLSLLAAFSSPILRAGEAPTVADGKLPVPASSPEVKEESVFDQIWGLATLYKNKDNPFIQEIKLRGRYQGQYYWLDSDQGNADDWENRRSRLGFDVKFLKNFELRLDAQSNDEFDPFYDALVDAYIKWKPSEAFNLTVGRQKPQLGYYDFLQSTNTQPTFERSQIFNQLRVDRVTGVVVDGKIGNWTYQAGVYSNEIDREFGQFDGGVSFGAGIGYDLKEALGTKRADLRFDWLHSEIEEGTTILDRYEDLFSATFWLQDERWGLVTEVFAGTGSEQAGRGDVIGFYVQPTYDLLPKRLQLVGRYTFSSGDGADSVQAQSRYERNAPRLTGSGRGDQYQAGYAGLQYFIYGDKLKLMAGAEYASLDGGGNGGNYDGWTFLSGVRFSF